MDDMPSPALDIERARMETPGCREVINFNNCGAALMPALVVETVKAHLDLEARIGGYEAEDREAARIAGVYDSIARLLGAAPDEIALVENATVAWNMAFFGMAFAPGDRILTARAEYASNYLNYLAVAERTGAVVEPVPNDAHGQVDVDALEAMIDGRVKLIAITHVPTNGGLVNPAAAIGRVARKHAIPYLLDACQSVGQMPIDVEAIGCDMLSATGRKYLRGPRGTGFLYVRRSMLDRLTPPWLDLRAAAWTAPDAYELAPGARRFENWEFYVAGILGLGAAVDYALGWGLESIRDRVQGLAAGLRERLAAIPGVAAHDLGREKCGIVTFTVGGLEPQAVVDALTAEGIATSVSAEGSTLLDMRGRGLASVVRAGVHYYNSEDEAARFIAAVRRLASEA